ncbi:MAG TPA: SDR family NAD(P)-dependent oxidoreductase [Pyrinomonadaceae bacterium]|nr:SDR family NAD(P)-dependent oxidoreductase [Pyrinomonadaceae bacterium]
MTLSSKSVAVVTGAASGIGRALAIRLAEEGIAGIAIADVDEAGLNETASKISIPVSTHLFDVSDRAAVEQFAADVIARHGSVTHLINNAGVGVIGTFRHLSIEDFEWLMGINFWGVIYCTKAFLPSLLEQNAAHIVNVSSVFGFIAPSEQSAYVSSKFAVRGFTESLRAELSGTNVAVSVVHPGGVKTNIARNSRVGSETPAEWKQQGAKFFDKVAKTSPETAAEIIVAGIKSRNSRILIGTDAKLISLFSRLFPKNYLRVIERIAGHKMSLRSKR